MEPAPQELIGIDEVSGKSPETRIKDGASARALVTRLIKEDEPRNYKRALVDGMIDGNPPYDDAKRRNMGLGWTANLNFMGGKALMDSSSVPYYALFNTVEQYADCCTAHEPGNPNYTQWNRDISVRFHELLKRWKRFDWSVQQASYQMRKHGVGPCFFDKKGDWRFRAMPAGSVLVPKESDSFVDERTKFVAVRVTYSVVELWGFIKNEAAATAAGWDVECVKKAIINAAHAEGSKSYDWQEWQKRLKDDDLATSYTQCDSIRCAHLLVQEFSGKISHFIVTEDEVPEKQNQTVKKGEDKGFLFRDTNTFGNYLEVLVAFFLNIGTHGTWHSVNGKAKDAFKHLEIENRLLNRIVDGAFIEGSLVFQPTSQSKKDKLMLMQVGPMTIVPPGGELRQTKLAGFLDGPIAVHRIVANHLSSNVGNSGSRSLTREDGRGEMPTATQIDMQAQKESRLGEGDITLFYQALDSLYSEMFRRAADPNTSDEEAKRFQRECKEHGVPAAALKDMKYVRANRVSGYGSPQMRQRSDEQMMPVLSMLPEDGKQNFLEDYVGGVKGADKVSRYVPRQHIPNNDDAFAAMENAMVEMGRQPVIAAGQNDIIHLTSHLEDASQKLLPLQQAMEQGPVDPAALQSAYQYVTIMGPHIQQHLARIDNDSSRKGQAKLFREQLGYLVAFHGKLRSALRQAQREAEIAQQQEEQATALSALDAARVQSVMTDSDLKAMKTVSGIENTRLKTMNSIRMNQIKTAEGIRQQRVKQFADIKSQAVETAADVSSSNN